MELASLFFDNLDKLISHLLLLEYIDTFEIYVIRTFILPRFAGTASERGFYKLMDIAVKQLQLVSSQPTKQQIFAVASFLQLKLKHLTVILFCFYLLINSLLCTKSNEELARRWFGGRRRNFSK